MLLDSVLQGGAEQHGCLFREGLLGGGPGGHRVAFARLEPGRRRANCSRLASENITVYVLSWLRNFSTCSFPSRDTPLLRSRLLMAIIMGTPSGNSLVGGMLVSFPSSI